MRASARVIFVAALVAVLCFAPVEATEPRVAADTRSFTHPTLGLTVVGTEIELPPGSWEVTAVAPARAVEQIFLMPRSVQGAAPVGRRIDVVQTQRQIDVTRGRFHSFYYPIVEYARTRGGQGPAKFSDLDEKRWGVLKEIDRSPWSEDAGTSVRGPFYFLIPGVTIPLTGQRTPGAVSPPLVLELRPFVDDGKHWVLFADGRVERQPIDTSLLARHGLTMSFVRGKDRPAPTSTLPPARYFVFGLLRDPAAPSATLTFTERAGNARQDVRWPLSPARAGGPDVLAQWAQARAAEWWPLATRGQSPVLQAWLARLKPLYGAAGLPHDEQVDPARRGHTTDVFSVMGGRAAIRETVQLELIRETPRGPSPSPTIPITTIRGVEVKSHPFDQMLAGKDGGQLPLAELVPPDRLFVYVARPSAVFPFLDSGGDFLFRTGSLFTSTAFDDDLKGRYLRRLGLSERTTRLFLESGEVTEIALLAPDLFFIDGTDVTVLMRMRAPDRLLGRMAMLGFPNLRQEGITERPGARPTYWARHADVLALSTSRTELSAVLALAGRQGAGSLGRSAEFRYMLTQQPIRKETRVFAYFSDPFIRHLVGPAVKIGQLRRMRARADMEMITAGALLYLLDAHRDKPELARLITLGYVPASVAGGGYALRDDLSVASSVWGTAAELRPIGAQPIDTVTPSEAEAYRTYVNEYSQYWRQYFDPIAMRLDDAPDGALELSTFILPLVDSAMYNMVRGFVATRESGSVLRVPALTPAPSLLLSLNLVDSAWVQISGSWSQMFSQYTGISPALFDHFGPGFHVALQDGDPIIALGNADLLGAFSGAALSPGVMGQALPLVLSVLTRPCKVLVELQNEAAVLDILRRSVTGASASRREMGIEFRQVEGRDAWIYAISMSGLVKIRFGIEVRNGYLILSNIPWSQPVTITSVEPRVFNGGDLQLAPGAIRQGLPGLFATWNEQNQRAAIHGMAALYPLLLTVAPTPDGAAARYAQLFGGRPVHPGPGGFAFSARRIESTTYGTATRWRVPAWRPDTGDFGLFDGVSHLGVNMQLEADGLRAVARWLWKGK